MRRRDFFQATGIVSIASLPLLSTALMEGAEIDTVSSKHNRVKTNSTVASDTVRVWHFSNLWRLDHLDGLSLQQGQPVWQRDATYVEPHIGALSAWPTVYQHTESRRWRMLYSADWKPYTLMIAESQDGRHWQPAPQSTIDSGIRDAPHQLFTLNGGSGGGVYLDPVADDGFPFKVFVHQRGDEVVRRAKENPEHRWHTVAKQEGAKRYLAEEFTLASKDGINWRPRYDLVWSQADWHPEPPIFGFYNRHSQRHQMTVRPGWGDRRQCLQSTTDFQAWSGPELLLEPDALDQELLELYGMPVFPYGDGYVGLLWMFHCDSEEPTRGFNRFVGKIDCQLAFSQDGNRFTRGKREPFIACNAPGEHGGGAIQPSCLVETDDEIRIYSAATKVHHGKGGQARRDGIRDNASILLHTLRKDGLMLLQSDGNWGRLISKPLVLLQDGLSVNAVATHGELQFQLTDMESRPVKGFTFDDCVPLTSDDQIEFDLKWKDSSVKDIVGRIVRLEIRMRHAQLFAIRGLIHFIDAQDRWLIEDGKPIAS